MDLRNVREYDDGKYYHLCTEMSSHRTSPSKRVYVEIENGEVTSFSYGDIGAADRINFCPHCGAPKESVKMFAENRVGEILVTQDKEERSKGYFQIEREFLERSKDGS